MSFLAPGPYVKFHEDFKAGERQFEAGQTILAPVFQRALEEAGQLDSVKYPRPEFRCVQCGKPVRFRRKSVSKRDEREVTRVATFTGERGDHRKNCLFSRSSKDVRHAQQGGADVGDPDRPFVTHFVEPKSLKARSAPPLKPPSEQDIENDLSNPSQIGKERTVRNHRTSQLSVLVDSYEVIIEEYPDVMGNWTDPKIDRMQKAVRNKRKEKLEGMGLVLPDNTEASYQDVFRYVLSKDENIEDRGECVWFAKMSKVLICTDGLIIIAHENKKNPEANAGVVLKMDVASSENRAFMDELKESLTYYVFGQVIETEFQGKPYRFVTPRHLAWVHPGEHPFWGYGKVKFEQTGRTLAQTLAPPIPTPAPTPEPPQPVAPVPFVPLVIAEPSMPVTSAPKPMPPSSATGKAASPPVQNPSKQKKRGFWATIIGWLGRG